MKDRSRSTHLVRAGVLALICIAAGLPGLNGLAIYRGDEKFYVHFAQEMLETGNYLVPTFYGEFHLTKPPLCYWLIGLCLFSARLPSLLAAGLTVALAYCFAFRLYRHVRGAVYASLFTASCYTFYWHSRVALTDMVMTLGVTAAAICFYRGVVSGERKLNFLLASLGVGLAGMAKGHVGAVVSSLPLVGFVIFDRESPDRVCFRQWAAPWTWLPALLLCGWWYVYLVSSDQPARDFAPSHPHAEQTLREAFFEDLGGEGLGARTSGGLAGLASNLKSYPVDAIRVCFPWSLLVLAGFILKPRLLLRDWRENRRATLMLFMLIVPLFCLFTFVILQQARSRYLLPMSPAVSILAARYLVLRSPAKEETGGFPLAGVIAVSLLLFYNLAFVVVTPWVKGRPLEELCEYLKPRLKPGDLVLIGLERSKEAAYATALLAHRADYVPVGKSPGPLLRKINEIEARDQTAPRGSFYLITTKRAADAIPHPDHANLVVPKQLKEAVELEGKVKLRDVMARIRVKTSAVEEDRLRRLVLLQLEP